MVKSELQEDTTDEGASKAIHDLSWIDLTEPDPKHNGAAMRNKRLAPIWREREMFIGTQFSNLYTLVEGRARQRDDRPVWARLPEKGQAKRVAHGYEGHLFSFPLQDQATLCRRAQTEG